MKPRSPRREERWLVVEPGVRVRARHLPGNSPGGTVLVMVHGFNASLDKPENRRVMATLSEHLPVIGVELRGHGRSSGASTLGGMEIMEVDAAVGWGGALGYSRVITVGFSMGAMIVVRHAAVFGGLAGVVAVSGPAYWGYQGTPVMRLLTFVVEHRTSRSVLRRMGTTIVTPPWPQVLPLSAVQAAEHVPPQPFLIAHGSGDEFFPLEHAHALRRHAAAGAELAGVRDRTELLVGTFGHAEAAMTRETLRAIAEWCDRTAVTESG